MKKSNIYKLIKFRKLLRSPGIVSLAYILFILSISYLGSKTIWSNYFIWEIPSLVFGLLSSLGVMTLISIFLSIILASSYNKKKFSIWWQSIVRHGVITFILLATSFVLLLSSILIPTKTPFTKELLNNLSKGRDSYSIFLEKWMSLEKFSKYKENKDFLILKKIYEYRSQKEFKPHEYEKWANYFTSIQKNVNPRISLWAKMLTADALDRMKKSDEAFLLYSEIVKSNIKDKYLKWWSFSEMGYYYNSKNKKDKAVKAWIQASNFIDSSGLNQNIAIVYEENNKYKLAEEHYFKALSALKKYMEKNKKISLVENEATLYVNWGNMYQNWFESLNDDSNKTYIEKAKNYLMKAQQADPSYIDAYWNMARLHIQQKEYNLARWTIEKAIFILNHKEHYELNRFNYQLISKKYVAYLSLIIDFQDKDTKKPTDTTLLLCKELIGWKFDKIKSLEDFFKVAKESGLNMSSEKKILEDQNFINFISST